MAQLDPMLEALGKRPGNVLALREGGKPCFRSETGERAISQTSLERRQLSHLLAELSDGLDRARIEAGDTFSFEYHGPDGRRFLCKGGDSGNGLQATLQDLAEMTEATAPAAPATATLQTHAGEPRINTYLRQMVVEEASDLHLSAEETPRLRLHGDIVNLEGSSVNSAEQTWEILREIMNEEQIRQFETTHDLDFAYEIEGLARFRVNVFADRKGPGAVLRVIPADILTAEQLGLDEAILGLCRLHKGLVLVTGPTGSGKSTTLAAMVDWINRNRADHIITIEDPIEFVHPNKRCLINQREIGAHTSGFKKALRAALREDPDIVLVGELRDLETIAIAIETAETGHLVFGTLHTTTAASTIDRVIDQFPADRQAQIRTMLSESLKGVIAQNLLKKKGGGRVAALEVLIALPSIANLIREGKTFQIPSIMQTGKRHGMVLLNDALVALVKEGKVEPEEAWAKAIDKVSIESQLKSAGFNLKT